MTVHAFVDESARPPRYLVSAAIVDPSQVRRLRQSMRALLLPGQRELHFKKEKPTRRRQLADVVARLPVEVCVYTRSWHRVDEPARQDCLAQLVHDLLARQAHRLVIDTRSEQDIHDERTMRRLLGPHPSGSQLVYEHVDSTSESLLWIADITARCFGAGAEWRKRVDPIISTVVDLEKAQSPRHDRPDAPRTHFLGLRGLGNPTISPPPAPPRPAGNRCRTTSLG